MIQATFVEKIQETPTDWSFRFKAEGPYPYEAGQYSVIRLPLRYEDKRGNARTCSFSSSPTEEYLQFTFTITENDSGFKQTLMEYKAGETVELTPARGKMALPSVTMPRLVMIAGGIGVTPYRGILKYVLDSSLERPDTTLIYSDKTLDELAFYPELKEMEKVQENIHIHYTLTRHEDAHGVWEGPQGRISPEFIKKCLDGNFADTTFMVCGPPEMVKTVASYLLEMGVPHELQINELFTGY